MSSAGMLSGEGQVGLWNVRYRPIADISKKAKLARMNGRIVSKICLLCLTSACVADNHSKASTSMLFSGDARQYAEVTGDLGSRFALIIAHGDPRRGAGMQADCELHAREDGPQVWRLVPFNSQIMQIDAEDIGNTSFSLKWQTPDRFVVETDFDLCAEGINFNGTYRAR